MSVDHHAPASKVRRTTSGTVLEVRDLHVTFPSEAGPVRAVRGLDFDLAAGETMAIVGESGSGKSVTSLAIMGLHPEAAKITGSIKLHGDELLGRSDEAMSRLRGEELAMIFQDPLSALTPVYTIGDQIVEAMQVHHYDLPGRRPEPGRRAAGPGRHPQPRRAGEVLPARVLRRHAAAGHDRHGDRQRPRRDHRRRADHGAGRHHPGAGAGGAEEGAAGDRRRGDHDHPRPRRGGRHRRSGHGDVRRSSGRAGHASTRSSQRRGCRTRSACWARSPGWTPQDKEALATLEGNPPSVVNLPPGCPFAPRCPMSPPTPARPTSRRWRRPTRPGTSAACIYSARIAQGEAGLRRHLPGAGDPRLADRAHSPRPAPDRAPAGRHEASLPADEGSGVPSPDRHRVRRRRDRPGGQGGRDPRPGGRVGLRQEHHAAGDPEPQAADGRTDRGPRPRRRHA